MGTLINEGTLLNDVRDLLPLDAFYIDRHKDIYKAILSLADNGERVDILTVVAQLPKIGVKVTFAEVAEIASNFGSSGIEEHVAILVGPPLPFAE